MINIHLHAESLKISWIRRVYNGTMDNCLLTLLKMFLPETSPFDACFGNWFVQKQALLVNNPFWKDVCNAYNHLLLNFCNTPSCQPLWKNSFIKINNSPVFYKQWFDKGVRFVNDLLDNNGKFLSFNDFQKKYNIMTNFVHYYGLCKSIKEGFGKYNEFQKIEQPIRPDIVSLICKYDKGCSHIYSTLLAEFRTEQKSLIKWRRSYNLDKNIWREYSLVPFNCSSVIDLRWFQYKLLNNILYTNDMLLKFKIVDKEECSFCRSHPESIIHLFCECQPSLRLWSQLQDWILQKTGINLKFTRENILFGFRGSHNNALNCILIKVKQTLYNSRQSAKPPSFAKCKLSIIQYYLQEKYIAQINCRYNQFEKKWCSFKNMQN